MRPVRPVLLLVVVGRPPAHVPAIALPVHAAPPAPMMMGAVPTLHGAHLAAVHVHGEAHHVAVGPCHGCSCCCSCYGGLGCSWATTSSSRRGHGTVGSHRAHTHARVLLLIGHTRLAMCQVCTCLGAGLLLLLLLQLQLARWSLRIGG